MELGNRVSVYTGGAATGMSEDFASDHDLIDATRKGDEAAFAEIVERYRNPITNFLYRFLNDYEEAVDLAQETFVRVYFAIDRYHSGYAFSTYIYRIASNLAISELRRRKRRRLMSLTGLFQREGEEAVEYQPADYRPLPDATVVDDERSRVIAGAIATLPPKYRVPIILRDIEGLSYEQVAEVMELGLGTTKSRINRGRGLLKDKLRRYFDESELG
jgi:RNA polymerase sigma-70 factor, ECF subfamily